MVNSKVHPLARLVIERSETPACRSSSHTVPPNRPSHPSVTRFRLLICTGYGCFVRLIGGRQAGRCEVTAVIADSVGR